MVFSTASLLNRRLDGAVRTVGNPPSDPRAKLPAFRPAAKMDPTRMNSLRFMGLPRGCKSHAEPGAILLGHKSVRFVGVGDP